MFSLQGQGQPSPQALSDLTQNPSFWEHWKYEHPEFQRDYDTKITYDGNGILILGGISSAQNTKMLNLILVDPESQTFEVIPSVGDAESCCWCDMSACYWKDSTIVVCGGWNSPEGIFQDTVAIITLENMDSENPSAHWEKIVAPSINFRGARLYIYKDKMYVFQGCASFQDVSFSCLDLTEFTWTGCNFKDHSPKRLGREIRYIFHGNKAYSIQAGRGIDDRAIQEFDLENLSCKLHKTPKIQTGHILSFEPCPQVINRKIYVIVMQNESPPMPIFLAFDLDSLNWIKINSESFPTTSSFSRILYCDNHLIFYSTSEKNVTSRGEFWSLPLKIPKPSKYSATSAIVDKTQQTMKEFLLEAPYSDISFEVESEIIKAHKWWLIQKNKFFANMFASGMSESQAEKIKITDIKAQTFKALLEFLYSDHVEINDTIALELLQQADKYSIGELKNACEKHLVQSIELENYVALGQIAELIGATALREAVVAFIAKNMKKLKQRKDFNDISDALFRDSLVKFIVK